MDPRLLIVFLCASIPSGFGYDSETYRCPSHIPVTKFVRTLGNMCYQFVRTQQTWYQANEDCSSKKGNLITITNKGIQDFVVRSLNEFHWPYNGVWIGATDLSDEMNWKWVTGQRVSYNNWSSGQPSCHVFCFEDCAQLRMDDGGRWHDYKCNWVEDYSYICQFPLKPKSTTTTTTTTTRRTTTSSASTTTTTTTTASSPTTRTPAPVANSTVNSTFLLQSDDLRPDVQVEMLGNSRMSQREYTETSESDTGTVIGLVLGLICGLALGLCIAVFVLKRRNKKQIEELPSVFFSNPYYADARAPLNSATNDDFIDSGCCAAVVGGASSPSPSQAPTPVKRPLCGPPVPRRAENVYNPGPTFCDDVTAKKVPYNALGSCLGQEEGAVGGAWGEDGLVDNHYDYSTGENFYESVDNVRLAIQQNALNEEQEDRYVPFQFDSTPPAPPRRLQ